VIVFGISTVLSSFYLSDRPLENPASSLRLDQSKIDPAIDQALEFSLQGAYDKSFILFNHLASRGITRAKLYLAVAYYHGQGTEVNKLKAKEIFMGLKNEGYESGIVDTYLNLLTDNI
jgi:TPR repeat protein